MRPVATDSDITAAIAAGVGAYKKRLEEKGREIWMSPHEISGQLTEEFDEFKQDVHDNIDLIAELEDIIVAAMHGIASIKSGKMG